MSKIIEPSRELIIADECDVIVCGGGPAGVAAAIAAARVGVRVRLFESQGCLGGIWTSGLLSWILDCENKNGLMQEIKARLEARKAGYNARGRNFICDVEEMKLLLETMCTEAGVEIQLHTRVSAAVVDASNSIKAIITESKSGRQAWGAKCFIDATGDGDLAAQAGCGFDYGREENGETQPMSMIALLSGVNQDQIREFNNTLNYVGEIKPKKRLLMEMQKSGVEPSYIDPTLWHVRDDLYIMMANHEYGVSALDAAQITEATMRSRAENHSLVNGLRSLGGAWSNIRLIATAAHIGVREGRRIHGIYKVSSEDIFQGKEHRDAVCKVQFQVDVHSTNPIKSKGYDHGEGEAKPYDIPFRALIARDVKGILMAGRCISGDFLAHSSYRVTGNAVAMGQAAGVGAAMSAVNGKLPQNLLWEDINAILIKLKHI